MPFNTLKEEYRKCSKCPLLQNRIQVVFGSGNPNADVLFIGEAPGANEDKNGIPFCGMSGKILDELLATINLSREDIFITNTVMCRPPENRNPKKEEIENCRSRLDQLIAIMKPSVIVTIGNFATERIIGKTGIKTIRGKKFPISIGGQDVTVVPIVHPASYLYSGRNPELFALMKSDFATISEIIDVIRRQKTLGEY
jgi:DNA polymerase